MRRAGYARLFADERGESHFEEIDVALVPVDFAPPAPPLHVTALQQLVDQLLRPMTDRPARSEWGWEPAYSLEGIVDDFLDELGRQPLRYG